MTNINNDMKTKLESYMNDEMYKKNIARMKDAMTEIIKDIQENAEILKTAGEEAATEKKNEVMEKWHHIMHAYHDTLADLKARFGIATDDVLEHTVKSFIHKAKEAGYEFMTDNK